MMPSAACQAAVADVLYNSLNSNNANCRETTRAVLSLWRARDRFDGGVHAQFPPYFVQGMLALKRAGFQVMTKSDAYLMDWTLLNLVKHAKDGNSEDQRRELHAATLVIKHMESQAGSVIRVRDVVDPARTSEALMQGAYLFSRVCQARTDEMDGATKSERFTSRGLSQQVATSLAELVDDCLNHVINHPEAWTYLNMNGDEATWAAIKRITPRKFAVGGDGLVGCDGGLNTKRRSNGVNVDPRADWCVADGKAHVWCHGRLEGEQNICDAEFFAKTVATMITKDRRDLVIIYDSKSSARRYDKACREAHNIREGRKTNCDLHRHPARTMIKSCANILATRQYIPSTRWCKSHKALLVTDDDWVNDSADRGATASYTARKKVIPRLRSGADDFFVCRRGYGVYSGSIFNACYQSCLQSSIAHISANSKNRVIVHAADMWPAAMAAVRSKSSNTSRYGDLAVKASAKQLPTSKSLLQRYGAEIITNTLCVLCGGAEDTQTHLCCDCPCTQAARDKIYGHLITKAAEYANTTKDVAMRTVKSCWKGSYGTYEDGPLQELTYFGYLPASLYRNLKTLGVPSRLLAKLAKDTVHHCQRVTYKLMWKVRTDHMKAAGRTLAGCLRAAGKVAGVAPADVSPVYASTAHAIGQLTLESDNVTGATGPRTSSTGPVARRASCFKVGTPLWMEPTGAGARVGAYGAGAHLSQRVTITAGHYRYVVHTAHVQGQGVYITTDSEGKRAKRMAHSVVAKALVHTSNMASRLSKHARLLRRSAVTFGGTLYAVWGTFDTTPQGSSVLLYSGGHTLVVTTDAEIQSRYHWLPAAEYDEVTRTALNSIWESAAQMDMWYLLGAMTMTSSGSGNSKVDTMRSVITGYLADSDAWTTKWADGSFTTDTTAATVRRLRDAGDCVAMPSLERGRDSRAVEQAIGQYLQQVDREESSSNRAMRTQVRGQRRVIPPTHA